MMSSLLSSSNGHFGSCAYRKCPTSAEISNDVEQVTSAAKTATTTTTSELLTTTATPPIIMDQQADQDTDNKLFIDDLTERRRLWRVPWFIICIDLLQLGLHVIGNACLQHRLIFMPAHKYEYWRYFTYMLLHSDLLHLLLNLCLQSLIGFALELEQGHGRTAFVYIAGGISGSLVTAWLQPQLSLLGASAGVYALLMSHIPHLVKNFRTLPHRYLRIVALLILSLSDIGFTTFHFLVNHNTNPKICLEAHIAGGIAGLLFGFIMYGRGRGGGNCLLRHE